MRRTTRRRLTHAGLYTLLVAGLVALAFAADWGAIKENFFDTEVLKTLWPEIITVAAVNTIKYTAIAFSGGLALALVFALMRLSTIAPYRWIATGYIEFFRGLPALVVILAMGFGVPIAFGWHPLRPRGAADAGAPDERPVFGVGALLGPAARHDLRRRGDRGQ